MKSNCIVCGNSIPLKKIEFGIQLGNFAKYCSGKCKDKNKYDEVPNDNCKIGYIYCLFLDNNPIYIGQTTNIRKRIKEHKCNIKNLDKLIYRYIRWYAKIKPDYSLNVKTLKCCSVNELDSYEKKYIHFSLTKGYKIKNDCVYTKSLSKFS